jgi:protein O-GlcNAc transferase
MRFNIETTSNGGTAPDEHYINKFNVPRGSNGIYMKNLNKIQTLGCFFNNLGNSYKEVGNIDSSLLALERAVQINPTLSESRANLGNIYLEKGKVNDAINQYREALRINPHDAKTHNNMGNAYVDKDWLNYAVNEYHQ